MQLVRHKIVGDLSLKLREVYIWFLFLDIMMSSKYLLRNILSIPKYLRAASLHCSHCLECQVSGSLLLYVHSNKVSLNV